MMGGGELHDTPAVNKCTTDDTSGTNWMNPVAEKRDGGFWVNYSALSIGAVLFIGTITVAINDHNAISRLEERFDDLKGTLTDNARTNAQVMAITQKMEEIDKHLEHSDKIDDISMSDRQDLKYRVARLEDQIKNINDNMLRSAQQK